MNGPTQIVVSKDGEEVFRAQAGRMGCADSARLDFLCFASPIIGAAYTCHTDAAERIAQMGYSTTIVQEGVATEFKTQDAALRLAAAGGSDPTAHAASRRRAN